MIPETLDWYYKGIPTLSVAPTTSSIGSHGLSVLDGSLMLPVAVLRKSALDHNRKWMRAFLNEAQVDICPHGKTSMSPELLAMQIDDGAWGITAATVHHVRVYRQFGIQRILMANQLLGSAGIRYVLEELDRDPAFDFYALADSIAGIEHLRSAIREFGCKRPVNLLVEIGAEGGRTGARSREAALAVAESIHAAGPELTLRGIETFEGIFQTEPGGEEKMEAMLERLEALALECVQRGLFSDGEIILTAGGSSYFDRCAARLSSTPISDRVRTVLRSGCYISHDSGMYETLFERLRARTPAVDRIGPGLRPALEIWAYIQSVPEASRAIAGMGKRDAGIDSGMPRPLWWFRPGIHDAPQRLTDDWQVTAMFDQHAYVDGPAHFAVGDLVGFGISHPCTTFDKWRALYIVDDDYRVISAARTYF